MQKNILKNKSGTSLIEIMFAVSIFVILIGLTLGIFKSTIESQKSIIASQDTQESLRFLFEIMSKEIRSAQVVDHGCEWATGNNSGNEIYDTEAGNTELYFKNKNDECVAYYIDINDDLVIRRRTAANDIVLPITPNDIKVTSLIFDVTDNVIGVSPDVKIQPCLTMKIEVEANNAGAHKHHMIMQTTVSSRYYK
ncbi:hypothetical protein KAU09_02160 [Candidatus Parcubacteria bacterium]|nr:hypothetical protein [Candidatus Parcubacteria bacterium]